MARPRFFVVVGALLSAGLLLGPGTAFASSLETPAVVTLLDAHTLSVPIRVTCEGPRPTDVTVDDAFVVVSVTQGGVDGTGFLGSVCDRPETLTVDVRVTTIEPTEQYTLGEATLAASLNVKWCCNTNPPCDDNDVCQQDIEELIASPSTTLIIPRGTPPPNAVPPF